jgi:hypothetical protein
VKEILPAEDVSLVGTEKMREWVGEWGDLGRSAMDIGIELVFCFPPMPIRQTIASQLSRMIGSLQRLKNLC